MVIDREKDRAESSPVRGDGTFFYPGGVDEPSPCSYREIAVRAGEGRVKGSNV